MVGSMRDPRVVIVGAGTAGLAAAVEFAARDEAVEVLDAAQQTGGALHVSWGQMSAAGTRLQEQCGIEDTPDEHFDDVMRISHGTADPVLVRKAVDLAPATIDWLMDSGFDMAPECPALHYYHEPYLKPRTYWGVEGGRSVLEVLERLRTDRWGSRQTLSLGARLERLEVDADGVTAVHVQRGDDTEVLRPEVVVLASGGYAANPARFREWTDGHDVISPAAPTSDGSAIATALVVGAQLRGGDLFLPTFGGIEDEEGAGRALPLDDFPQLTPQSRRPWEVFVDQGGRRFVDEDGMSVDVKEHALLRLPGLRFWVVYDSRAKREAPPLFPSWEAGRLERAFAGPDPSFVTADSIEGLAERMGVPSDVLEGTIRSYNDAIASGRPDDHGREHRPAPVAESPFFAVLNRAVALKSPAGLVVDGDLRVIGPDGRALANLYAIGEAIGGATLSGRSFVGGMSVTPALSFGRLLGSSI